MTAKLLWFAFEFFKTGLFAIGGGLATLPFLYDISERTGWFSHQDIANMIAIAQATPGPTGINMATYIGFDHFGILGAIIGPISLVIPSVLIIILVSKVFDHFKEARIVHHLFYGLRPASSALILAAGISVANISLFDAATYQATHNWLDFFHWKALLLAGIIFVLMKKKNVHPILLIALSAIIGILFQF